MPSPAVKKINFKNLPSIGITKAGQEIKLGGFSGLHYMGKTQDGRYQFATHTDRGPNGEQYNGNRPFALPEFTPRIIIFSVDLNFSDIRIEKTILLKNKDKMLTGLPNKKGPEDPVDVFDYLIEPEPYDPMGMDLEALFQDSDGHFWLAEEYAPSFAKFNAEGSLIKRYLPRKDFSQVFEKRRSNRGFEAMTLYQNHIWVFLQSPLKSGSEDLKAPVLVFNPKTKKSFIRYYPFETAVADKIGDATPIKNKALLVLEQSGEQGTFAFKKVFLSWSPKKGDTLRKRLFLDLSLLGIHNEKLEGMTFFEEKYLAVINDNDFGLKGIPDYLKSGMIPTKAENSSLFIIDLSALPENPMNLLEVLKTEE